MVGVWAQIIQTLRQSSLLCIENQGQIDEEVAYYINVSDKTSYFTPQGVTFVLAVLLTLTDTLLFLDFS